MEFKELIMDVIDEARTSKGTYRIYPDPFDLVCVGWDEDSGMFFVADLGLVEYETKSAQRFLEKAPEILERMLQEFYAGG